MKKHLFLLLGLTAPTFLVGCEKTTVSLKPNVNSSAQESETQISFYVRHDSDSHWNYQFISDDDGLTKQPCQLIIGDKGLVGKPVKEDDVKPALYFSDEVTDETWVQIKDASDYIIFEKRVPAGASSIDLREVIFGKPGTYTLVGKVRGPGHATVYLNNYFAYK